MILYVFMQHLFLISVYIAWFLDRQFMNLGYIIYHSFPVFSVILTLMFAKKIRESHALVGIFFIVLPMIEWIVLGNYVQDLTLFDI